MDHKAGCSLAFLVSQVPLRLADEVVEVMKLAYILWSLKTAREYARQIPTRRVTIKKKKSNDNDNNNLTVLQRPDRQWRFSSMCLLWGIAVEMFFPPPR